MIQTVWLCDACLKKKMHFRSNLEPRSFSWPWAHKPEGYCESADSWHKNNSVSNTYWPKLIIQRVILECASCTAHSLIVLKLFATVTHSYAWGESLDDMPNKLQSPAVPHCLTHADQLPGSTSTWSLCHSCARTQFFIKDSEMMNLVQHLYICLMFFEVVFEVVVFVYSLCDGLAAHVPFVLL